MTRTSKKTVLGGGLAALVAWAILLAGIVLPTPETETKAEETKAVYTDKHGDEELAYLLVKLELKAREAIGARYTSVQPDERKWMAKHLILPAAVAGDVFADVVPGATGGRAWVKMVVENPRNPKNRGDAVALELLRTIQEDKESAEQSSPEAYYYGEPIKATVTCLPCHGKPQGDPDPFFPEYKKDGWRAGEIVGAVIACVKPEK